MQLTLTPVVAKIAEARVFVKSNMFEFYSKFIHVLRKTIFVLQARLTNLQKKYKFKVFLISRKIQLVF